QFVRFEPHRPGDTADMPACVEIATACGEVVLFDPPDNGLPNACALAHLRNAETGPPASLRKGFTNAHATPPLPYSTACPRDAGVEMRMPRHPAVRDQLPSVDMPPMLSGNTRCRLRVLPAT